MTMNRVVVVGGSIASLTAVETLRVEGYEGRITVLSAEDRPFYTRVPLSKEVLAGKPLDDTALVAGDIGADIRVGTRATALDVERRVVVTTAGDVPYDGLVIATGSRARRLGGGRRPENVLRTADDCIRLREKLIDADSVLVVGGGVLGMEIASTCLTLDKSVTVLDVAPPMQRFLGAPVAAHVRSVAEAAGVEVVADAGGVELLGDHAPTGVQTADGRRFEADLVVSAVGDLPNVEWLAGSGLDTHGALVVDERCRVRPGIVAAGDVAVTRDAAGAFTRMPSWTNAVEQGRTAARALLSPDDAPVHRPSRYFWTEQFGLDIKMIGSGPTGEPVTLDGDIRSGRALLCWPDPDAPSHVLALNHPMPPAKLKRLARNG